MNYAAFGLKVRERLDSQVKGLFKCFVWVVSMQVFGNKNVSNSVILREGNLQRVSFVRKRCCKQNAVVVLSVARQRQVVVLDCACYTRGCGNETIHILCK